MTRANSPEVEKKDDASIFFFFFFELLYKFNNNTKKKTKSDSYQIWIFIFSLLLLLLLFYNILGHFKTSTSSNFFFALEINIRSYRIDCVKCELQNYSAPGFFCLQAKVLNLLENLFIYLFNNMFKNMLC